VCPDHLKEPNHIEENNYFFHLSKFQDFLENYYKQNSSFVVPNSRFNEVKSFVKQ
jgi:methionyl-tRNA synthetase